MSDQFLEPEGSRIPGKRLPEYPTVFDLTNQRKRISVPQAVLDQARNAGLDSIDLDLISLFTTNRVSRRNRGWAAKAPYMVLASSEEIYIYDKTLRNPEQTDVYVQVLRIDFDPTTGEVVKVWRDADSSIFRQTLAAFPRSTIVGRLRKILEIDRPSRGDTRKRAQIVAEERRVVKERGELLNLVMGDFFMGTLIETKENADNIHKVGQGEYSVATNEQVEWLAAYGTANPCYIVSIYDRVGQRGALTEIDAIADGEATIDLMAKEVSLGLRRSRGAYQVTISGGGPSSVVDLLKAYNKIRQWQQFYGDSIEVRVSVIRGPSANLALNLNTGEVRSFERLPGPTGGHGRLRMRIAERLLSRRKSPARFVAPPIKR